MGECWSLGEENKGVKGTSTCTHPIRTHTSSINSIFLIRTASRRQLSGLRVTVREWNRQGCTVTEKQRKKNDSGKHENGRTTTIVGAYCQRIEPLAIHWAQVSWFNESDSPAPLRQDCIFPPSLSSSIDVCSRRARVHALNFSCLLMFKCRVGPEEESLRALTRPLLRFVFLSL